MVARTIAAVLATVLVAMSCAEVEPEAPIDKPPVRELRFDESLRFTPPKREFVMAHEYDFPDGPPPRVPDELLTQAFRLWPVRDVASVDWNLAELGQTVRFDEDFTLDPSSVRLLAWRVVVDARPLRIQYALIWAQGHAADGSDRWGLASTYRHPSRENEWRRPYISHTPLVPTTTHERRPTHADILNLVSSSYWLFDGGGTHKYQPASGWVHEDAGLNRSAWDECFGGLPPGLE